MYIPNKTQPGNNLHDFKSLYMHTSILPSQWTDPLEFYTRTFTNCMQLGTDEVTGSERWYRNDLSIQLIPTSPMTWGLEYLRKQWGTPVTVLTPNGAGAGAGAGTGPGPGPEAGALRTGRSGHASQTPKVELILPTPARPCVRQLSGRSSLPVAKLWEEESRTKYRLACPSLRSKPRHAVSPERPN